MVFKSFKKLLIIILIAAFTGTICPIPSAQAQDMPWMPMPGIRVDLSPEFTPIHIIGLVVHPEDALRFDFLMSNGQDNKLSSADKRDEYQKLIKYFMASMTVPDEDQWVNLSPYEKNRIIMPNFAQTEMGRDLLSQDYLLKQIASSLTYPEKRLGKEFWDRVYERAQKEFGTTQMPLSTFNKVWIVPDHATLYEKDNAVYVIENRLKVMMEEDYLSLQKHSSMPLVHTLASQIMKEIIIPELNKEVNTGKNFAPLRQVFNAMVLAAWYKRALKTSILGQVYANKSKIKGINLDDLKVNDRIYQQYLRAFKKGVFNYIKEDQDRYSNQIIPHKYFSGGASGFGRDTFDQAVLVAHDLASIVKPVEEFEMLERKAPLVEVDVQAFSDNAMSHLEKALGAVKYAELGEKLRRLKHKAEEMSLKSRIKRDQYYHNTHAPQKIGSRRVEGLTDSNGDNPAMTANLEPGDLLSKLADSNTAMTAKEFLVKVGEHLMMGAGAFALFYGLYTFNEPNPLPNVTPYDTLQYQISSPDSSSNNSNKVVTKEKPTVLSSSVNPAMVNGGIDLNAANLDLRIKRDGRGIALPLAMQDMKQLSSIEGFVPVIIGIKPITNLLLLSQLQQTH